MARITFVSNKNIHKESRTHDYLYGNNWQQLSSWYTTYFHNLLDPTFTVSTAKDFYKHAMLANMRCAQYVSLKQSGETRTAYMNI